MSKHSAERHKRSAVMLGHALTISAPDVWNATSRVWAARLSQRELAAIAFSALKALPKDHIDLIVDALHFVKEGEVAQ